MPETAHLPGNPFALSPAPKPTSRPKHKAGNPFAAPTAEIDTFPELYPEEPARPAAPAPTGSKYDPTWLSRQMGDFAGRIAPEAVKGGVEGVMTAATKAGAGVVRYASRLSPAVAGGAIDPTDPQMVGISDRPTMDVRAKAGEDVAGSIRNFGKRATSKIPFAPNPTTGQKVARVGGNIAGQLAPFVAAGPLGLAAGSALNVATEMGAEPEESLLGMFSKEHAKSPVKRGLTALAGDAAIAAPLLAGKSLLTNYLRAKRAVTPEELARMGEAIPGAAPAPEGPALPSQVAPEPVSRVGAIGNQPPVLPTMPGKRGPVVDLAAYPLGDSPGGKARARPAERYQRTTKGGRGGMADRSWMDESPLKDESQLTDRVLSGQQRRVLDLAHEVADASPSGGIVVDPGHKTASSVRNKIARKELAGERPDLSPLQQIGDINRASVVVAHPNDAGPVIAKLQESGWLRELDDKFAKPDELGYGAIHAQLVDPVTGQVAELQIHTPQTWAARQDLGGHDIYDYLFSKDAKPLVTPADHREARRLIEYNRKLYAEAHEAAMTDRPLPGADSPYKLSMDINPESPAYGRWSVRDKATGDIVAEADNPFKARTMMNELSTNEVRVTPSRDAGIATPVSTATTPATAATIAPKGVVSTPESARLPRTGIDAGSQPTAPEGVSTPLSRPSDVPRGNISVNPFREQHPLVESTLQGPSGSDDVTYFGNRAVQTRWRVVEAGALVTSNHPHTFERNPAYPAAIQGRVYHGSAGQGAREQVVSGAQNLEAPRIVNPTRSIGGPPTLTPEGFVVAGNQRGMMQQRVYDLHPEKAAELRAQIAKDAQRVGIDPATLEGMERPVLVREIVDPTVNVRDENTLRELNELSDKATLKTKDPLTEAMGRARQLKANSGALEHYAATSSPEEPLSEYLQGPNGLKFLNKLVEDKVLLSAELDGFRDASTGKITKQGRQKLQDMMSAAAVGDASIIDQAPAAIVGKLETGTPRLIAAAQVEGWSLERPLQEALELHTSKTANGQKTIADALAQPDMMGREAASPQGQTLARFLESSSKPKVTDALRSWSEAADKAKASDGSADMFGVSAETADEAFGRIFGGARRPEPAMVGGARRGSIAGPASNDPYNYAAMKMLTSMAGTGIGGGAGATAGSKIGATPEERKRNAWMGAGIGGFAGALTPFAPEIAGQVLELASKLRSAGAEVPAKLFQLHVTPEIVRVKISGRPSQEQMTKLFTAIQKNPKATFRYSVRDLEGREVGAGRSFVDFGSDVTFSEKNAPLPGRLGNWSAVDNPTGAIGNQPAKKIRPLVEPEYAYHPRPEPRPPTRTVRSAYNEPDKVYWPRNSRESVEKARSFLNLAHTGLDKTAAARVRALIASGLDKGTIGKGYRSFAEMDLSTVQRKRELLKELVEDPNTLIGADKLENIPTDDIKAMWLIAQDNTKTIEAAARVMNDPLASAKQIAEAAGLHDAAYKQTEELLSSIVTGTAQKAREFGALRNIAKQSTDPEVWLVQAKRMMGDRPLPDAIQANIRKLARRAQEACL